MYNKTVFTTAIVVIIALATIAVYVQGPTDFTNRANTPTTIILRSGTIITINSSDHVIHGGAGALDYTFYGIEYNLSLSGYYVISGSWKSTGKSLVWILDDNEPILEYPVPNEFSGILNQTLLPSTYGNYTLVIAGYLGEKISIMSTIELENYSPIQVGSFSIPAGTQINSTKVYSFYLDSPSVMVGSFSTPGGIYSYSFSNSPSYNNWASTSVTDYNSSAMPALVKFSLNQSPLIFGPGNCSIDFSAGKFYVNQTIEYLLFFDNSS